MGDHITRYDRMPIPARAANTEYFEAGVIKIGVEYRVLTDAVAAVARLNLMASSGGETGRLTELDDCGVSLHVHGLADGESLEYLRFDCFQEEPHYHYVGWSRKTNELLHIDPVADGDPRCWSAPALPTSPPWSTFARSRRSCPKSPRPLSAPAITPTRPPYGLWPRRSAPPQTKHLS
jgi:hypothetical protein